MTELEHTDPHIESQAAHLERMLPALNRAILGTPADHPLAALPLAQLRLCNLLLNEGRRTMSQLSDDLGISVSAVTQMADRLEKADMVARVAEPDGDRRTRHLTLTDHGLGLMLSRQRYRVQRASDALQAMTAEQREQTFDVLNLLQTISRGLPVTAAPLEPPL